MLEVCPMTLKEANAFVEQYHRHHGPVVGHKFSIGCSDGEKIVGVVIVGRPVSRHLDDGWTLEVNRLCSDGTRLFHALCCGMAGRTGNGVQKARHLYPRYGKRRKLACRWLEVHRTGRRSEMDRKTQTRG